MSTGYYRKGRTYELFIRKSFNCKSGKRYGADESLMIQLFINESNKKAKKSGISYNRQFFKVKLYIEKALTKLKKKKKYINSYNHFSPIYMQLKEATTTNDLIKIVNHGLRKIIELENQLKKSA